MTYPRLQNTVRPKISTMPRLKSEASLQLDIYKLVSEKQIIQQELILVEQRSKQLNQRLTMISTQIVETEKKIQDLRNADSSPSQVKIQPNFNKLEDNKFQTFYLEY